MDDIMALCREQSDHSNMTKDLFGIAKSWWLNDFWLHCFHSIMVIKPAPLSAHLSTGCECTASQIETPVYARRTTTHQFIWQQQHTCGAPGESPTEGAEWLDNLTRLHTFILDTGTHPPGMTLPRIAWVRLKCLCTGDGRFRSCLYKWGMASSAACECGTEEQTVDHVVLHQCLTNRPLHGLHGLAVLDDETMEWLLNTCPEI